MAVCFAGTASSTTIVEGSLFEDLQTAHSVITARIADTRVETDVRGIPQTIYELDDVVAVKGDPPYPFEIRIDGGALDSGLALEVPGVPKFAAGDRVLLFLRFDNPVCPIIGFQVRSFRISGSDTGRPRITTYDGLPILGLDAELRIMAAATAEDSGLTLQQFVGLLAEMMTRPEYEDRSR